MKKTIEHVNDLAKAIRKELEDNLVPFWLTKVTDPNNTGFIGQMSNEGRIDPQAPKGLILNARLLWTYSALFRFNQQPQCRDMARRAYDYLQTHFWDSKFGGAFWLLDCKGNSLETEKKIYGQAFYVYAMAEYYQAFSAQPALERAVELFDLIELHSHDDKLGGYFEVCNRDWSIAAGSRLSEKDMAEKKSMNNHLHILEAYTNLYRVRPDQKLKSRLVELLNIFTNHIIDADTKHMNHFFDDAWQVKSQSYTFGHDVEASWLLCEAAEVLGGANLISQIRQSALRLAWITLAEGLDSDGGLCCEGRAGKIIDPNREWWPQAECLVGFLNAYQLSGDESFLTTASNVWEFITGHIVDYEHGDWFWRVDPAGRPDSKEPKVSQWKGPYHSVRMCLEAIRRLKLIAESKNE